MRSRTLPVMLMLLLAGCAAVPELAWRQVDRRIVERANDWLKLEPRQERHLQERLQPWLRGIRRDELSAYANYLRRLAVRLGPDLDEADARWAETRFRQLYDETVDSFLPVIAPTLADLTPRQVEHLEQRFRERNKDYRERFVDGRDEGRYAIAETMIKQIERWTGPLDTDQRSLIHDRAAEYPVTSELWLAYRRRMQSRVLQDIRADRPAEDIEHAVRRWWIERADLDAETAARGEALRDAMRETLVALGQTLSPLQRAEARRRLRARADDLQRLAESAQS